jgi:hypothetical protein
MVDLGPDQGRSVIVIAGSHTVVPRKTLQGNYSSCDLALRNDSCSAMGTPMDDFKFTAKKDN